MRRLITVAYLVLAALVATSGTARAASITFSDSTFNLGNYTPVGLYSLNPDAVISTSQCANCGDPGSALDISLSLDGTGPFSFALGLVNNAWLVNPSVTGTVTSIAVSADKNFTFTADDFGGFVGQGSNTFRPLIVQNGVAYMAAIPGPTLTIPPGGTTGFNTFQAPGLLATDFLAYDFTTGLFGVATPDFTTSFLLGLGQISSSGAFSFTNTVSSAQYDNLQYTVSTVPEPGTMLLLGTGLALGARRIRARRARG